MAEIEIAASGKRPGVRRGKKLSTKVDLTPMVDLGFLLITFFVFSTTMSMPASMHLAMPKDGGDSTKIPTSTALTAFPMGDGKIFYYHGSLGDAMKTGEYGVTTFSYSDGIGEIIRDKRMALERMEKDKSKELYLVIKPTDDSNYRQLVDMLDEATINLVLHYSIGKITEGEKEFISKLRGSL
jgi:hypothetical protein